MRKKSGSDHEGFHAETNLGNPFAPIEEPLSSLSCSSRTPGPIKNGNKAFAQVYKRPSSERTQNMAALFLARPPISWLYSLDLISLW